MKPSARPPHEKLHYVFGTPNERFLYRRIYNLTDARIRTLERGTMLHGASPNSIRVILLDSWMMNRSFQLTNAVADYEARWKGIPWLVERWTEEMLLQPAKRAEWLLKTYDRLMEPAGWNSLANDLPKAWLSQLEGPDALLLLDAMESRKKAEKAARPR